jgi:hypothetical protein
VTLAKIIQTGYLDILSADPYIVNNIEKIYSSEKNIDKGFLKKLLNCCRTIL